LALKFQLLQNSPSPRLGLVVTARVALVTVNAVVHIPVYVRVLEVAGIVIAMAARALEYRVVPSVNVTRGALAVGVAVVGWESRVLRVIECGSSPRARSVAGRALRCREEHRILSRRVRRVCGAIVVALVARNAGIAGQVVIVVDVTIGAHSRGNGVHSGQGEAGVVVIKGGICPVNRVVAGFARRGESGGCVCRVSRSGVVLLVARVTKCAIQRIVVVDVTIGTGAWRYRVRVGQRETCRRVVKLAIRPLDGVVAGVTSRREPGRSVGYRCGRVVVVGLVARHASRTRQAVVVVDVAVRA